MTSGCAEAPQPLARRAELSTGGEVFHILCKRVAAAAYPDELTGVRFNAACDGGGEAPNDIDPRFAAMIERREEIVAALDQVFGDNETKGSAAFGEGELDTFLANLIPFYDLPDEWTPKSTRALANIMGELVSKNGDKVRATLGRVAPRVGYRPIKQVLGVVRPSLTYPRLDELTRQFLKLVTKDGSAYPAFTDLLKAGALELAEEKDPNAPAPADSTLRAAMELLLASDPALALHPEDPALWVVQRDDSGIALPTDPASTPKLSPFARTLKDKSKRDADGRAVDGDTPLYQYMDANRTVFAALMREQKSLLERTDGKSTVENLARGLRTVMGPTVDRTESFGSKASLKFKGPDVENGALFELVHALSALARYDETTELLTVLDELMRNHESDGTAPVYAGLRIDEISDEYPDAKIIGLDGEGMPHEFWDDLIYVGTRMLERKGQFDAVIRSFADPQSVASTHLIAKFMKYKDQVSYNGAPITLSNGRYSDADATKMNSEIVHTLKVEVDRMAAAGGDLGSNADVGMNRSLFQRLISTIHATNMVANCNKDGAQLNVNDPTTGAALTFPDPTHQPPKPGNNLEGVAWAAINLLCGYKSGQPTGSFKECEFVRQPNGAEAHMRAILDQRTQVFLKNEQLACLDKAGLAGDLGATQEKSTQITGFTLKPTAPAIARFVHAPRTKFTQDLFAPFPTKHGVALADFEPDILLALEMKQPDVKFNNAPQSFLQASRPLGFAFDDHEFFENTPADGPVATHGYMFAELLATLHMHWPSRRASDFRCSATVKKGDEGCSQSGDPKGKFYSPQSNLVSYEPLLIRALEDEKLGEILQKANETLGKITITGVDGKKRDGITVLTNFLAKVLTPDATLTYRDGRTYSYTNTCVPMETTGADGKMVAECVDGRGRIVSDKGVMPLYLVLDALKSIDKAFEGDNAERHEPWLTARSALVDQFLTVNKDDVTNPAAPAYALKNRRAYAVTLQLIPWVLKRIDAHRQGGDLVQWADGLTDRLAGVLGHPAMAAGLDLLDVLWKEDKAGDEFSKLNAYLMDEEGNPDAFQGLIVAATDTSILVDRDSELTPLFQFASLALAPNALEIIASGGAPNVEESAALATLELTKRITDLYPGSDVSPLARLLKNAVLADADGQSPLEEFIDSSAEVNRADPTEARDKPLAADDYKAVFEQVQAFLSDKDRGMERLYKVIQGRDLSKAN